MRSYLSASLFVLCCISGNFAQSKITVAQESGKSARLILSGLDPKTLAAAEKLDAVGWGNVIAVVVANGKEEEIAKRPPVLGNWKVDGTRLLFEPKFPLGEGVKYRILLNQARILDPVAKGAFSTVAEITIPKLERVPTAKVIAVYPTRNVLPENQLKFYAHFSAPMSRGEVYRRVQLRDEKGKPVEAAFIEIDEELWDRSGQRITLLLDPGRVKHGLKPREEKGPILEEGKSYTLVISKEWKDAEGTPLIEEFRKTFKVTAPDTNPPDPKTWKLDAPALGQNGSLQLRFPEPMDHALLQRVLWVVDRDGKKIPGAVSIHEEETLWRFTPEKAWTAGEYKIVVETILEDLAANGIGKAFEVEGSGPKPITNENKTVELPFKVATVR